MKASIQELSRQIGTLYLATLVAVACSKPTEKKPEEGPPQPTRRVTFKTISRNILEPRCMVCHNSAKPRGKVDLTSYEGLMASEGHQSKPLVAGDPGKSGIFKMISEKQMPPETKLLSADVLTATRGWISNGALEVTPGAVVPPPPPADPGPAQPTYEWLSKAVFARKCASCHGVPYKVGNVDFTSYATLMASSGFSNKAVIPANPEASGIYHETSLGHMPPERKLVSDADLTLLQQWIADGAPKN